MGSPVSSTWRRQRSTSARTASSNSMVPTRRPICCSTLAALMAARYWLIMTMRKSRSTNSMPMGAVAYTVSSRRVDFSRARVRSATRLSSCVRWRRKLRSSAPRALARSADSRSVCLPDIKGLPCASACTCWVSACWVRARRPPTRQARAKAAPSSNARMSEPVTTERSRASTTVLVRMVTTTVQASSGARRKPEYTSSPSRVAWRSTPSRPWRICSSSGVALRWPT
ncbi:hypothetical protein JaAD80_27190 [Janthinobacterium sp. AD80]|nr:hypothetical protein JaAD80_27190 [Janthinobacterium sp. AD80]